MKRYIPMLIGGLLILPIIFESLRKGSVMLSVMIVLGIAAMATIFSSYCGTIKGWRCSLVFALGALITEIYFFVSWYFSYGHSPEEFSVGANIALIEWVSISVVGSVTAVVLCFFIYRIKPIPGR